MAVQWYRANDSIGTGLVAISGATEDWYNSVPADNGKYVMAEVNGIQGNYIGPIAEFTTAAVGMTKILELDFEAMAVGTYTSMADSSGNGNTFTPQGAANFSIVADGDRRGIQLTGAGLLSLRNSNPSFWKKLHDGTVDYTIFFEGRAGENDNPNSVYGICGTSGGSNSNIGLTYAFDDRDSINRQNGLVFTINNALGSGNAVIDSNVTKAIKANYKSAPVVTYKATGTGNLNFYCNRSIHGSYTKTANAYSSANATYDMEVGACGNSSIPFVGVIYRLVIFQGVINATNRHRIEGSRGALLDLYPISRGLHTDLSDGRYNSFGPWVDLGSKTTKMFPFRSGTSHEQGGRIDLIDYDVATQLLSNRRTIFPYTAPYDARDPRTGVINGKIYIFFTRADSSHPDRYTYKAGYIRSTDLTGTDWEPFVELAGSSNYFTPWGKCIEGNVPGEFFLPWWEITQYETIGGTYQTAFYKTTDGDNWTKQVIYSGTELVNECAILSLGEGKMIAFARLEDWFSQVPGIAQFMSSDDGDTWTAFTRTNLVGPTKVLVFAPYYDAKKDTITMVYQSRDTGFITISYDNPVDAVFTNPLGWKTGVKYEDNNTPSRPTPGLGYPDWDGEVLLWYKEDSTSAAHVIYREENFTALEGYTEDAETDIDDVFVIIGDSKAMGGSNAVGPTPASGTVYQWNRAGGILQEVTNSDVIGSNIGSPWPKFGIDYNAATGKKIALVPCGSSGAEFSPNGDTNNWSSTGTLYAAMVTDVNACLTALGKTSIAGVLVVLGINDIRAATTLSTVHSDIDSLITRLNSDFTTPPIYFSMPGRSESTLNISSRVISIRNKLRTVAESNANVHIAAQEVSFASISGYMNADNLHFLSPGNNKLGELISRYIVLDTYSKEARSVFASLDTDLSTTRKDLIEDFIAAEKANGNWALMDAFQFFVQPTINNCLVDWRLTTGPLNTSATLSANDQVNANGTNQHLRLQINPTINIVKATTSDFALSVRTGTINTPMNTVAVLMGCNVAAGTNLQLFNLATSQVAYRSIDGTNGLGTDTHILSNTLYTIGRTGTTKFIRKNGALDASATLAKNGTDPNADIFMLANSNNGTANSFMNGGIKAACFHKHTGFNYSDFYTHLETLITNW